MVWWQQALTTRPQACSYTTICFNYPRQLNVPSSTPSTFLHSTTPISTSAIRLTFHAKHVCCSFYCRLSLLSSSKINFQAHLLAHSPLVVSFKTIQGIIPLKLYFCPIKVPKVYSIYCSGYWRSTGFFLFCSTTTSMKSLPLSVVFASALKALGFLASICS